MSEPVTNPSAERNLLAAAMRCPAERLDRVLETVTPDDLYDPLIGELWTVLGDMRRNDQPTDPTRVMGELRRRQLVPKLQTLLLDSTTRTFAVAEQAGFYSAQVIQAARQRELQNLAIRLDQRAAHPDADPDALLDDFDDQTAKLRRARINADELPPTMETLAARDNTKSWVVPGMIAHHDRIIVVAHEGHGKSLHNYQVGVAVAAGLHPFTLQPIEPQNVLVIDCENDEDTISDRSDLLLAACLKSGVHPENRLRYVERPEGLELNNPADAAWLARLVTQTQPRLLVIGPLYRLTDADLAKEEPSRGVMSALDRARVRGGCALLMEAHVGNEKQDGNRPHRPYGTSAWRRWGGIGLSLKPANGYPLTDHVYKVTDYRGRRSQRDWPEHVSWGREGEWPWRQVSSMELAARKDFLMGQGIWRGAA